MTIFLALRCVSDFFLTKMEKARELKSGSITLLYIPSERHYAYVVCPLTIYLAMHLYIYIDMD